MVIKVQGDVHELSDYFFALRDGIYKIAKWCDDRKGWRSEVTREVLSYWLDEWDRSDPYDGTLLRKMYSCSRLSRRSRALEEVSVRVHDRWAELFPSHPRSSRDYQSLPYESRKTYHEVVSDVTWKVMEEAHKASP